MDFSKLEQAHYHMQVGMYFSGFRKIDGAILLYSNIIDDPFWNYAALIRVKKGDVHNLLTEIDNFYKSINRSPACYITPQTSPQELPTILSEKGYQLAFSDAWMLFTGRKLSRKEFSDINIKTVENINDMKTFINVFNIAYGSSSEDEPYAGLPPSYGEALYKSFINQEYQREKTVVHYLGYVDSKPVGIATLIIYQEFGGIYNVGVIPEYRKKGIGTSLSLKTVKDALGKYNVNSIFLQTEFGSYVENFYKKLGFETIFRGDCYVI